MPTKKKTDHALKSDRLSDIKAAFAAMRAEITTMRDELTSVIAEVGEYKKARRQSDHPPCEFTIEDFWHTLRHRWSESDFTASFTEDWIHAMPSAELYRLAKELESLHVRLHPDDDEETEAHGILAVYSTQDWPSARILSGNDMFSWTDAINNFLCNYCAVADPKNHNVVVYRCS